MSEHKEIELNEKRAIVSLPSSAVSVDITCKLLDGNNEPYSVYASIGVEDVWEAFNKADNGYFFEAENPHAEIASDGDSLAMLYIPEDAVYVHFECTCIGGDENACKEDRILAMADIRRAFEYAERDYIDDYDTFYITEKGKEFLEQLRANREN